MLRQMFLDTSGIKSVYNDDIRRWDKLKEHYPLSHQFIQLFSYHSTLSTLWSSIITINYYTVTVDIKCSIVHITLC